MRVLALEYSGRVREAFRGLGHEAWSCDLLDSEDNSRFHIKGDIRKVLRDGWDLALFFPPCTHLAVSGARHFEKKRKLGVLQEALAFVEELWAAPIEKIALENPVSIISTQSSLGKPTQVIQPWQHGHGETKSTCLWLKNLPRIEPTNIVDGREQRVFKMPPSPDRWKNRSRTYTGIAAAFAKHWG